MTTIQNRLQLVENRILKACHAAKRDRQTVQLLAVSKTFDAEIVYDAFKASQRCFGENYIQEAVEKIVTLKDILSSLQIVSSEFNQNHGKNLPKSFLNPITWHCIGSVQSNKTRLVAEHFDWLHTLDRIKIAQRLSAQRDQKQNALQVCLQINVDAGSNKSGIFLPDDTDKLPSELIELALAVTQLPQLKLRGIMSLPEPCVDFSQQLALHQKAHRCFERLKMHLPDHALADFDTLSIGMSADLEAAIHAGSTMIRVGSAIFGSR